MKNFSPCLFPEARPLFCFMKIMGKKRRWHISNKKTKEKQNSVIIMISVDGKRIASSEAEIRWGIVLLKIEMFKNERSRHSDVFLRKGVLKLCNKFTGEHRCQGVISIKLLCNFFEITLRHGRSPVNLLHNFRTTFLKNTSEWLLLKWDE